LAGNRTPIRQQLCSLIGFGHVTAGNPSSSQIVIAIAWLRTRIAIFPRLDYCKIAIVWQALYATTNQITSGSNVGKVTEMCSQQSDTHMSPSPDSLA